MIDLFDRIRTITFCINRGSFPALWSQAWPSHHEAWCLQDACCTPSPQICLQQYHRDQDTLRKDAGHLVVPAPSQNPSHAKNLWNANTATGMLTQTHSDQNIFISENFKHHYITTSVLQWKSSILIFDHQICSSDGF